MTMYAKRKSVMTYAADRYWDFTNVHANIKTAETLTRSFDSGAWAWVSFFVFLGLTIAAGWATWYFDIESTYHGLQGFTQPMVRSLPVSIASVFGTALIALFTVTPMFLEIFASPYARANIAVVKLAVLGFTVFDVVTDIPRTKQTVEMFVANGALDNVWTPLAGLFYWGLFGIWLLLATVGFQLLTIIFAYTAFVWLAKATDTDGEVSNAQVKKQNAAKAALQNMQAKVAADKVKKAAKVEATADDIEVITVE